MQTKIIEVTTKKGINSFIQFPFTIYRGNPNWVPSLRFDELNTLRQDKNPAFEFCEARYWLAYHDGRIVGRVAAILNLRHIEKWGQRYMRFGWLDFIDDLEVSGALLKTVEAWAAEAGMEAVHGPLGFTDLDREGMLVEGLMSWARLLLIITIPIILSIWRNMAIRKISIGWNMRFRSRPNPMKPLPE